MRVHRTLAVAAVLVLGLLGAIPAFAQYPEPKDVLLCGYANGTVSISVKTATGQARSGVSVTFTDASGKVSQLNTDPSGLANVPAGPPGTTVSRYLDLACQAQVPGGPVSIAPPRTGTGSGDSTGGSGTSWLPLAGGLAALVVAGGGTAVLVRRRH